MPVLAVSGRVSALAFTLLLVGQATLANVPPTGVPPTGVPPTGIPSTGVPFAPPADFHHRRHFHVHSDWIKPWDAPPRFASHPIERRPDRSSAREPDQFRPETGRVVQPVSYQPAFDAPRAMQPRLSYPAWRVSQIAARHGDRTFLMIDKAHGQIFLFENGVPVFSGAALTGSSLADRLPPDAMSKTYAEEHDPRYRVTPAGRFTVSPGYDNTLGPTLDINEIRGRDWTIAIHTAVLGARAGYRDARLRSPLDRDKHITEGCINVDADTMRQLARLVPRWGHMPLYILPNDERLIAELF
jgi:hypothetical protein